MNIKELIERLRGFKSAAAQAWAHEAADALLAQQVCIEQMVAALARIERGSNTRLQVRDIARKAITTQPSLEALREHDAEVVEKLANVTFKHDCDCGCPCDCYSPTDAKFQLLAASERIRKGEA